MTAPTGESLPPHGDRDASASPHEAPATVGPVAILVRIALLFIVAPLLFALAVKLLLE